VKGLSAAIALAVAALLTYRLQSELRAGGSDSTAAPLLPGIGSQDPRIRVDPDVGPWRAVGKLQAASMNSRTLCTATLVGPTSSSGEISPFSAASRLPLRTFARLSSLIRMLISDTRQRRGTPVEPARAPRAHPEFRCLRRTQTMKRPSCGCSRNRLIVLYYPIFGQCCVDRGMADPMQGGDGVPTVAAALYQMVLIDTAVAKARDAFMDVLGPNPRSRPDAASARKWWHLLKKLDDAPQLYPSPIALAGRVVGQMGPRVRIRLAPAVHADSNDRLT
jgi:hypothetical protein